MQIIFKNLFSWFLSNSMNKSLVAGEIHSTQISIEYDEL